MGDDVLRSTTDLAKRVLLQEGFPKGPPLWGSGPEKGGFPFKDIEQVHYFLDAKYTTTIKTATTIMGPNV